MRKTMQAALALLLTLGCIAAAEDAPLFTLSPWQFGAIAWIGGEPDDWEDISAGATQAVEDVFTLWELPIPVPSTSWEDPASTPPVYGSGRVPQVIKKNPETGKLWRLDPLGWGEEERYPFC